MYRACLPDQARFGGRASGAGMGVAAFRRGARASGTGNRPSARRRYGFYRQSRMSPEQSQRLERGRTRPVAEIERSATRRPAVDVAGLLYGGDRQRGLFRSARQSGSSSGRLRRSGRRVGLFFLASAGPLSEAFALAEKTVSERRLFIVDPWLEETRRFREMPAFGALRERIGLDGTVMGVVD